jgi:peptide/nickel transport system substrate-binding protein
MRPVSRRALATGGLTAAAMLATTALGTTFASAGSHHRAAATPQYGGTIVYALPTQTNIPWYFPIRNDANASLYTAQLSGLLYQPLIYVNDTLAIDYSQSIASKITYNKAGTVFNVFMNPKWHWSDGQPITSADAQFSWNVLMATEQSTAPAPWPSSSLGSGGLPNDFKSFKVDGPYEFTITLNTPVNQVWFEYKGIGSCPILPKHVWDKYPNNITQEITYLGQNATDPSFDSVVSGPFKLQSAIQNQAWTLVPNPAYDGHKAYVSRLILQYEGSDTSEFAGLKTGTIQVGYLPAAEYNARLELPDKMWVAYPFSYRFAWGNLNKGAENGVNTIFDQLYVRQAMMEGVNIAAINHLIDHGYGAPEFGPIPTLPKTQFLDPRLTKPIYPYDPAKGKALLEAHGWSEQNGVMTKGGQKMSFTLMYPSGNLATTLEMELLQSNWAKEGIQVTLNPVPFATLVGNLSDPSKWEMVSGIGIIYGSYPSGESIFYELHGLDADLGYNDPIENKLIQATTSPQANNAATMRAFYNYEYYTAQQVPAIWLPNNAAWDEVAPNVHGFNAYTDNWVTGGLLPQYWWVSSGS